MLKYPDLTCNPKVTSEIAFHEKAGPCQVDFSFVVFLLFRFHRQGSPFAPIAAVATLPSAVIYELFCSLQVGCFSLQPVLPPV